MNLSGHRLKAWGGGDWPTSRLLTELDRVYADPAITAERFFDAGPVQRIHISKRADLLVVQAEGRPVCVKYFHDRRLRVKLRTLLGLAKGRRGYRNGVRLQAAGIRVPEQLVCLEFRPFGPTVVVMELLQDIRTGVRWLMDQPAHQGKAVVSRQVIKQFAEFAAVLHRQGIYHCDFSPRNVMVQRDGDQVRFVLIDLEDVRFGRPLDRRRCIQNLARFAREAVPLISPFTGLRFFKAYCRAAGWPDSDAVRCMRRMGSELKSL